MAEDPLPPRDVPGARVTTDDCFVSHGLRVTSAGRYHDVFERDGDRWRTSAREIALVGGEPRGMDGDTT